MDFSQDDTHPLEQATSDTLYQRIALADAQIAGLRDELAKAQSNNVNLQTQLSQCQEALEAIHNTPSTPEEADCQQRADEAVTVALERFEAEATANHWKWVAAWLGAKIGTNKH